MQSTIKPSPCPHDTTDLTEHIQDIRWDNTVGLQQEADKLVHGLYRCFRKAETPEEGAIKAVSASSSGVPALKFQALIKLLMVGKIKIARLSSPIINKATSLITKTDLRKGMYGFMDRQYDETRSYASVANARWRAELHNREKILAPSNATASTIKIAAVITGRSKTAPSWGETPATR